jgi:hypothetical protein
MFVLHNNAKSSDDIYVLAHICLNASPSNKSRGVFTQRVVPQLDFNRAALRKLLAAGSVNHDSGAFSYKVDTTRFDRFFTALSYGIVYKACEGSLPADYRTGHAYHNFERKTESPEEKAFKEMLLALYAGEPMAALNFGRINALNATVYSVKAFGVPEFLSSITIVHDRDKGRLLLAGDRKRKPRLCRGLLHAQLYADPTQRLQPTQRNAYSRFNAYISAV